MAKTKVLLSIESHVLEVIDSNAQEKGLDRSSFITSLVTNSIGRPMVYYNEDNYEVCKKAFKLENPQHMVNYALALLAKQAYEKQSASQESTYEEPTYELD